MSESMSQTDIASQQAGSASSSGFRQTTALVRTSPAQLVPAVVPTQIVPDDGADMARYVNSFRRRWLMAVILGLPMAILAGYVAWFFQPQIYDATAILRVASTESTLIFETADNNRANPNTSETYRRTQRQWMRSRFVPEKTLPR